MALTSNIYNSNSNAHVKSLSLLRLVYRGIVPVTCEAIFDRVEKKTNDVNTLAIFRFRGMFYFSLKISLFIEL